MLFSYRLADRLHMIRSEMMQRMSAKEFFQRMVLEGLESAAARTTKTTRDQTPEEMLRELGG